MFKKWSLVLIVALLVVPFALAACGGDDDKDDNKKSSDIKLSQTFTDEASGLTVQYPDGWAAKADSGGVALANSQAALDADKLGENDMGVVAMAFPMAMIEATDLGSAFTAFIGMMTGDTETTTGEVTDIKVGAQDAKRMALNDPEQGDGVIVAFLSEDKANLIIAMGAAPKDKLANVEPYVLAIAQSIKYTPPATE